MDSAHLFPKHRDIQMITTPPKILKDWWNNIKGEYGAQIVRNTGNLVSLMHIQGDKGLIRALVELWDAEAGVFRFPNFELCPTLEEIVGFTGLTMEDREIIVPKAKCPKKFCSMFELKYVPSLVAKNHGTISLEYLFKRFGRASSFSAHKKEFDCNKAKWEKLRPKVFVLALLGTLVFPCGYDAIDIRLSTVVKSIFEGINGRQTTLVPMILADMLYSLTECSVFRKGRFFGCNLLLQLWIVEHLHDRGQWDDLIPQNGNRIATHYARMEGFKRHHTAQDWYDDINGLSGADIHWNYSWIDNREVRLREVRLRSPNRYYIKLIGFRSIQPYASIRVMRQFGLLQSIPLIAGIRESEVEYESPDYTVPEVMNICNDWARLDRELIRQDQNPPCSPEYYAWARHIYGIREIEASSWEQIGFVDKETERHSRLHILPITTLDELMFDQVRHYPGYSGYLYATNRLYLERPPA